MLAFIEYTIGTDKLLHYIIYFFATLLIGGMSFLLPGKGRTTSRIATIVFTLTFIAIVEEYRHFPLSQRTTEFLDAIYSISGIFTAFIILLISLLLKKKVYMNFSFRHLTIGICYVAIFIPFMYGLTLIEEVPMSEDSETVSIPLTDEESKETTSYPEAVPTSGGSMSVSSLKDEIYAMANSGQLALHANSLKTQESIASHFESQLRKLQFYASIKVSQLYESALEEYNEKKNSEDFSYLDFLSKYRQKSKELEVEIDKLFEAIHNNLIKSLSKKGFNTDIAEEFANKYEQEKKEKRYQILKLLQKEFL